MMMNVLDRLRKDRGPIASYSNFNAYNLRMDLLCVYKHVCSSLELVILL